MAVLSWAKRMKSSSTPPSIALSAPFSLAYSYLQAEEPPPIQSWLPAVRRRYPYWCVLLSHPTHFAGARLLSSSRLLFRVVVIRDYLLCVLLGICNTFIIILRCSFCANIFDYYLHYLG